MLKHLCMGSILSSINEQQKIIILSFVLVSIKLIFFPVYPMDDYWRHYIVSVFNFDYRNIYFDSYLSKFNLWIGYDWLIHKVSILFGYKSFIFIQILSLFFVTLAFLYIAKLNPLNIVPVIYFFTVFFLSQRIYIARPTTLIGSMFFMVWILNNRILTYLFSCVIIPLYWLFFIPSFLLSIKFYTNLIWVVLGVLFWVWYSKGAYFEEVINLTKITRQNIEYKIHIAELSDNVNLIIILCFFLFPLFIILHEQKQKALKLESKNLIGFSIVYLTNQVRFVYDYGLTFLIDMLKRFPAKYDVHKLFIIPFAIFVILGSKGVNINYYEVVNKINRIQNANILVACDLSHFSTNATNNRYAPAMELNWMNKEMRKIFLDIIKGKVICNELKKTNIDYIIEKSLKQKPPECLELFDVYKDYRIWKIKK